MTHYLSMLVFGKVQVHVTLHNIGQIPYILSQLRVHSGKSQLSNYASAKYQYGLGSCHIMSRLPYVMTYQHTIYRGSPTGNKAGQSSVLEA